MSKKSKKKPFLSKLDNLFDEIDQQETTPSGLTSESGTSGWVWECDIKKRYTKVSEEVDKNIGLPNVAFVGELITQFRISDDFLPTMVKAFDRKPNEYPYQLQTAFLDNTGVYQLVNFHVLLKEGGDGWHGFAEVVGIPYDHKKVAAERTKTTESKTQPRPDSVETNALAKIKDSGNKLSAQLDIPTQDQAGLLEIIDADPNRKWTEDERILVQQVADQLGLALENANLFQQTQSALSETDNLYQASAELNAANTYADVVDVLREHTLIGNGVSLISVNEFDNPWVNTQPEWFEILHIWDQAGSTSWGNRTKLDGFPSIPKLLDPNEIVLIKDIASDARLGDLARNYFIDAFDSKSAMFIPITRGGQWIGFIDAFFHVAQPFSEIEVRQLSSIASQASEKIAAIRLSEQTTQRRANADRLNELARQMGEILSVEELKETFFNLVNDRLRPDEITMFEWDDDRKLFKSTHKINEANDSKESFADASQRPDLWQVFQENQSNYSLVSWEDGLLKEKYNIPWSVGEKITGVIDLTHTARGAAISDIDKEFIEGLALQAGSSLERARLFEQTQAALALTDEQARRLSGLNDLSSEISQTVTIEEIYRVTIDKTQEIFPTERISITLIDNTKENVVVAAVYNQDLTEENESDQLEIGAIIPLKGTANQTAILQNRVIMESADNNSLAIPSYIVGPLNVGGEVIGTLNVGSSQSNFFDERDVNFMYQLLAVVSSTLENRQLFQAIQDSLSTSEDQARRLAELNRMSEALAQANDLENVFAITSKYINNIIPNDFACFAIIDSSETALDFWHLTDDKENSVNKLENQVNRDASLAQETIRNNKIRTIESLNTLKNYPDISPLIAQGYNTGIIAPLFAGTTPIGALYTAKDSNNPYSVRDESLMVSIGSIISSTIDNRQLLSQIQRRSLQLEASAEVSRVASTILDTTELLPRVVNLIKDGFNLYYCGLFLVDSDGAWTGEPEKWAVLQAGTGEAGKEMLNIGHKLEVGGVSMIGASIQNNEARIALDVDAETVFSRNPFLPETRSEMALPLTTRGQVLGALTIQSTSESAFSSEDITALQTLADQVANTIENAKLFEQTEDRAEELTILNEMARTFAQSLEVDSVLNNTLEFTSRLMDAENFYLALFDKETKIIEFKLFIEDGTLVPPPEPRLFLGEGLTDWIITNKVDVLIPDKVSERLDEMGIPHRGKVSSSYLGVPMIRAGEVFGVIAVQNYDAPFTYGPRERDLLTAVANQATIAIESARLFQQAQHRARREQTLREITARVHSSADPDVILRTAVREVSNALGRKAYIQLGNEGEENTENRNSVKQTNGNGQAKPETTNETEIIETDGSAK